METTDIVITIVLIIAIIVAIILAISKKFVVYDEENDEFIDDKQVNTLTLEQQYQLFNIFVKLNQYITTVKEINTLIDQKAEVHATILDNCDVEYVSFDNLIHWKESYINQLIIYYYYSFNTLQIVKSQMSVIMYNIYLKQLQEAANLIDDSKKS